MYSSIALSRYSECLSDNKQLAVSLVTSGTPVLRLTEPNQDCAGTYIAPSETAHAYLLDSTCYKLLVKIKKLYLFCCSVHYGNNKSLNITNKRPMGLDALLENQLGHLPKFQKLHIYPLSTPRGRN